MKDSELDQLLELAQTNLTPQAGFQREVWLRIEAAESVTWRSGLRVLTERFFNWLALPPVAVATCSVMLASGIWMGLEAGDHASKGEITYIQSISPFAQTHR